MKKLISLFTLAALAATALATTPTYTPVSVDHSRTSGTAATISGTIPATQVRGLPTTLPATGGTAATISGTIAISQVNTLQTALDSKASVRLIQTGDFSATVNGRYTVSGTATVTDPTGTQAGQIYSVVIGDNSLVTLGSAQYASSRVELVREYNGSSWVTLPPRFSDSLILSGTANTANNQTLAGGTGSLLNQGLADARYAGQGAPGTSYVTILASDSTYIVNQTTPQATPLAITVPIGTYHVQCKIGTKGPDYAAGGVNVAFAATGSYSWATGLTIGASGPATILGGSGGRTATCNFGWPPLLTSTLANALGNNYGWSIDGILTATTPVTITLMLAQNTATSGTTTGVCIQSGSFINATRR